MRKIIPISLFFGCLLAFLACDNSNSEAKSEKPSDTPTSGELDIYVEEGYQPIISTTLDVFDSLYDRTDVTAHYVSEAEAVRALMDKTTPLIVISRSLTEEELIPVRNRGIIAEQTVIAYDGLAFIVHPDNTDSIFTIDEIHKLMLGEYSSWDKLNPKNKAGAMNIVFDNQGSGTVRYVRDSISKGELPSFATALKKNEEVINYVAKNRSAIGIISTNWISDTDDKGSQKFLKQVKLCGIAKETGKESFTPYQAYLQTGDYPFKRAVYAVNATPRKFSLAQGFASFMAGPIGQRIIYKDGLLPATMPIRLMEFKKE